MVSDVFRTQASIYNGSFYCENSKPLGIFTKKLYHRYSTELYIDLQKYWKFKSEAKVALFIAIVTCKSTKMVEHDLLYM